MILAQKLLNRHIESLFDMISETFIPDEIIGVKRGGFYLSKPLSLLFNKPHKEIYVSFYDDKKCFHTPRVTEFIELDKTKKYLICDDLIDRGLTINYIRQNYSGFNVKVATILQNKKSPERADFFADYYSGNWVTFPDDM